MVCKIINLSFKNNELLGVRCIYQTYGLQTHTHEMYINTQKTWLNIYHCDVSGFPLYIHFKEKNLWQTSVNKHQGRKYSGVPGMLIFNID